MPEENFETKPEPAEEKTPPQSKDWSRELWEITKVIIVALVIVLPIRYFIAQPFIVRGASMEPNFEDRDYLIIDELSYFFREPERGEAVVFRYPRSPSQFFIKRVIGLPGEKVEIADGEVKIFNESNPDGFFLEEPYLADFALFTSPSLSLELGPDEYFVLGDNRRASSDSRIWGALKRNFIVGRAVFRAWPVSEFGVVPDYSF